MSLSYDRDKHLCKTKMFPSPQPLHLHSSYTLPHRHRLRFTPKKLVSQYIRCSRTASDCRNIMLSPLCGSGIHTLISCFALEPSKCKEYYNSVLLGGLSSYLSSFLHNGFSHLFAPKAVAAKLQSTTILVSHSGKAMAVTMNPCEEVTCRKKKPLVERRVVVTGLGVVTPVGHDPDLFYNNLLGGISGITHIQGFDCTLFPTRIAGEIKSFSSDEWVSPKLAKRADKFMLYLLTAGKKALTDDGITQQVAAELDNSRCGVIIGSALGGMQGWMGPNYSISTACATSNFCILSAANHIIRGETDMMLCGGSDAAVIPIGLGGFVACKALSQRNNDPRKASRPWDSVLLSPSLLSFTKLA